MSAIKSKLQDDIKTAMKAREQTKLTTLRGISAAIKQVEIDTRQDLSDDDVLGILNKEVKKRRDSLKFAEEASREDLIEQNKIEIKLLQTYLGEEIDEDKLREIIKGVVDGGADSIGAIMGALNGKYKGRFEGKLASSIAKELLA